MGRKSIAEIRRKEIVEAFFKVIAEKGLSKATIREVAEAAGCSQGMLHHYFTNKEELILEVLDYVTAAYTVDFMEGVSRHEAAADRLGFLISWFFNLDKFDIDWSRALMEFRAYAKTDRRISEALREFYDLGKEVIGDIIRAGTKAGEFRKTDPAVTANMILASIEGAVSLWLLDSEAASLEPMGRELTEVFLGYLMLER